MRASLQIEVGKIYTRSYLRTLYNITDSAINNGIFKPKEYDSVWLFITEDRSHGMPKYNNHLISNILEMDGQLKGRTDDLIINHVQKGLELLLFYRRNSHEYEGGAFHYEGIFKYISHEGSQPTHFILQRDDGTDAISVEDLEAITEEEIRDEEFFEGGKKQRLVNYYERDPRLRTLAIQYHGTKCMICGFCFEEIYGDHGSGYIEVHHLRPVSSLNERGKVDPNKDMIVVCSNCHRMIHRKKSQVLSPEMLRSIIEK